MVKNLVYDYQLRKQKFEQDNRRTVNREKSKVRIVKSELPDDYPKDGTLQEKAKYMQKKRPPDPRLAKMY